MNFSRKSCRLWHNVEKYGGARGATNGITIWRIQVACWISKATSTHMPTHLGTHTYRDTYVILIAFSWQLCKRALMLHYMYIAWLVTFSLYFVSLRARVILLLKDQAMTVVVPFCQESMIWAMSCDQKATPCLHCQRNKQEGCTLHHPLPHHRR